MTKTQYIYSSNSGAICSLILFTVQRNIHGKLIWTANSELKRDIAVSQCAGPIAHWNSSLLLQELTETEQKHYRAEQTMKGKKDDQD